MNKLIVSAVVLICCLEISFAAKSGDVKYTVQFADDVIPCEDAENDAMDMTGLILGTTDEGEAKLGGEVQIKLELVEGDEFELQVMKVLEIGTEPVFNAGGEICKNLEKEDTPWYPALQSLNITSCPITVGSYFVEELLVSLEPMEDFLNEQFCGTYECNLIVKRDDEVRACHIIQVNIVEEDA